MTEISEQEFLHFYADIQRKALEGRATSGEMSQLKGRAREAGIDVPVLLMAAKFAKLDPIEYIAKLNRLITYLGYLRLKGANQLSLIQQVDPEQPPSHQDYFDEGFAASLNGLSIGDCPVDVSKKGGQKWLDGFNLGTQVMNGDSNVVAMPREREPEPEPVDDETPPEETPAFLTLKPKRKGKKAPVEEAPEEVEPPADVEPEASPRKSMVDRLLEKHGI